MKKITVGFFHEIFPNLPYKERYQDFEFSIEKRNEIISTIMDAGYNALLQQVSESHNDALAEKRLIIWIDNKRFSQR